MENYNEKTDQDLVRLSLDNSDNFLYLMRRYEGRLLAYINRISGLGHDEAQDILQDVFIKTYQNLNNFDESLSFSSWIYRITHNQVVSDYRKRKARPQSVELNPELGFLKSLQSDEDLNRQIDLKMDKKILAAALNKLDFKYREVLILKFWEERSYEEISDILKKPAGTVAALISRAKNRLKKILQEA